MEGVIDFAMREILTGLGGYDHAVTEFIRINDHLLPNKTFYKYAPELLHGGNIKSGTPVYIQLLGQHPNLMAENARRAFDLGATGIDLNFSCPAKTVNNHKGGSILLREPDTVNKIVTAVRAAVPNKTPVSVKMRLGYDDQPFSWKSACQLIIDYSKYDREMDVKNYLPSRIKQWFSYLKREYEEAEVLFQEIKTLRDIKDMQDIIYRNYL